MTRRITVDLTPLRVSREFRLLTAGQGQSMIGGLIIYIAIPIQVYDETRSTLAVGLIGLAELGPLLIGSIRGGAFADVVERVRLVVRVEVALAAANTLNGTVTNFGAVAGPGIGELLFALLGATGANVVLALACLAVAGGADTISAIFRSVIVQRETPDAMRGRVAGIELAQVAAAPMIGDFEAGLLASLTSVKTSIVSGGVACIGGIVVLTAFLPALDRYRRPPG